MGAGGGSCHTIACAPFTVLRSQPIASRVISDTEGGKVAGTAVGLTERFDGKTAHLGANLLDSADPTRARINLRQLALRDAADCGVAIVKRSPGACPFLDLMQLRIHRHGSRCGFRKQLVTWASTQTNAYAPPNSSFAAATTRSGSSEFSLEFF